MIRKADERKKAMTSNKLKKIQNTMLNVQNQLDVAINKLNGDHDEQRLAHMLSETRKVLTSAIEESKASRKIGQDSRLFIAEGECPLNR